MVTCFITLHLYRERKKQNTSNNFTERQILYEHTSLENNLIASLFLLLILYSPS